MSAQSVPLEIEAKYIWPDASTFKALARQTQLGDYALRPAGDQKLADHYLDTADFALYRAGYACRLRRKNDEWLVTLKSLGGAEAGDAAVHQRQEYEWSTPSDSLDPAAWPEAPGRALVLELIGSQPLRELLVIRQRRAVRTLWHGERCAAEVSLDRVKVELQGRRNVTREVEVELQPAGGLDDLRAVGEVLLALGAQPEPRSKFERALALFGGAAPRPQSEPEPEPEPEPKPEKARKAPEVGGDLPMAEAGRRIFAFHFERALARAAGARSGEDPEELHAMRVATRRQRAAWRLFQAYYRPKLARNFRQALRALGERLGGVRDLDVTLETLGAYQASLSAAEAAAFQPLLDDWQSPRGAARAALLEHLDGAEYAEFCADYAAFLSEAGAGLRAEPEAAGRLQARQARHILPGAVWDHYGALRAYEAVLAYASIPTLHTLRIECKRLRYLLEFFREAFDPCVGQAIERLVALQDHIGDLHDADVQVAQLEAFLLRTGQLALPPATVRVVGRYLRQRQAKREQLRRSVGRPWRAVNGLAFRRLLGRAIEAL